MLKIKLIQSTAVVAALILSPLPLYAQEETAPDAAEDEILFVPPPPTASRVSQDNNDEAENTDDEQSVDDEIDAELQAELEEIERLEKLSDPNEFLKTFALKTPLIELPTPDADRLVIANKIVARFYPVGTNERIMRDSFDNMMLPIIDRTLELTITEAMDLFGLPAELNPLDGDEEAADKKIGDLLAEMDPEFREKMGTVMDAYAEITGLTSEPLEPALAAAMARDYARKYDLQQLTEMEAFFATPTGELFARDFMLSTASIDMIQTALKEFPAIAENSDAIEAAGKRIEEVFKTEPEIEDDIETTCDGDTCETDEVAADINDSLADDLGNEPWFDKDNWDETTRENVAQLEDTYDELAELSEQAYSQYDEAFDAAVLKSREQYIADGWTREE